MQVENEVAIKDIFKCLSSTNEKERKIIMITENELIPMLGDLFIAVGRKYSITINPKRDCIEYLFSHDKKHIKGKDVVDKTITNKELCDLIFTAIKAKEKIYEESEL